MANDSSSPEPTYCFIDTNILIHRKTFDEIDWPRVVGADEVCLVVSQVVLKELDKLKNDKTDWIQERARTLLKKLRPFIRGSAMSATICPHVTLHIIGQEPRSDFPWAAHSLDPNWSDDRILASLLQFRREHPRANVCFVTSDSGPMSKAVRLNIPLVEEEPLEEIARTSTTAAALERVKRELDAWKNRTPKLEVGFWEQGKCEPFVTRQFQLRSDTGPSDEEMEARIADDTEEIQRMCEAGEGRVSDAELTEFRRKAYEYLQQIALLLPAKRSREFGLRTEFQFVLVNEGSAPATDVILDLTFPDGSFVVGISHVNDALYGEVLLPDCPIAKWMIARNSYYPFGTHLPLALPPQPYRPPPTGPRGPLYDLDGDRSSVQYRDGKMNQGYSWYMNPVIAYLPPSIKGGFSIGWTLRADELPKVITGTLNVKLDGDKKRKMRT